MTDFGYTLMGEQAGPVQLVRDACRAEDAGFDFLTASDHYSPWLAEQGHSPYVWSVLGAVAQATRSIALMTYVTCPLLRYHPAVVAQKAATMQLLSEGRFGLGLGAGENLNEHVVGSGWPAADTRHAMLIEAVTIIRRLWSGSEVTYRGEHYNVDAARIWDLPDPPPPIGIAVSGPRSCRLAGARGDAMIAVDPAELLVGRFEEAGGGGKPRIGQVPVCYDPDAGAARRRAREQLRWFGGGWPVNANLRDPAAFDAASRFVREDDVAAQVPCGPDVDEHVAAIRRFVDAGFTHVTVVQAGGQHQQEFLAWAQKELLPALRTE